MTFRSILKYGFAIFAMFFGSGNLVFPLQIGLASGSYWLVGFFGLFLTGIVLPFCGLFVIKLHKGDFDSFFGEAGRLARVLLPLFTLSLLGSFGVVPRCIAVAHGGLSYMLPNISLLVFSLIFCFLTYLFCLREQLMVSIVGKWMSPILLIALFFLIGVAFMRASLPWPGLGATHAFETGFLTGYQTMDLFAAFFFSALVFKQIQSSLPAESSTRDILKFALIPSLIGSLLLSLIYFGLVFLGAHYAPLIASTDPEMMLPRIVMNTMGVPATLFIAIAIIFSCLSTAVALNTIYARYLCTVLKLQEKNYPWMLLATTSVAFVISLLDFRGIAQFLAPVLELSYPGLIVLTIMGIFTKKSYRIKKILFWLVTISFYIYYFIAN